MTSLLKGEALRSVTGAVLGGSTALFGLAVVGLWRGPEGPERFTGLLAVVAGAGLVLAGVAVRAAGRGTSSTRTAAGMVATGCCLLLGAAAPAWTVTEPASLPVTLVGGVVLLPVLLLGYPTGRPGGAVGAVGMACCLLTGVAAVVAPSTFAETGITGLVQATVLTLCVWWRFETSAEGDRVPLLWLTLSVTVTALVVGHVAFLLPNPLGAGLVCLATASVPLAMAIGLVRPDLVDVRTLIVSVTANTVTAIGFVAVVVGIASLVEMVSDRRPSIGGLAVLAALSAIGFHPTSVLLRGIVDRVLFGDRADPITAASQVGERLSDDPVLALRALRESMVLPYAALVAGERTIAVSGTAVTSTREIPLEMGGREVGRLVVGLRPGEVAPPRSDETVLRVVRPALAQMLHARGLAEQLRESRGRVIGVVEDERRRLRRDLHDGLGPTLTGVAYTADAARNVLAADPAAADALLADLRTQTAAAITEIRRLVEGLRPPALDELGLVPALRQSSTRLFAADGRPLQVRVHPPELLPGLPAAVEVAAYRIVTEALTNVARHADSDRADVVLACEPDALVLDVRDHGRSARAWTPGVGLTSMRERAEQLGGTLTASATPDGGRVLARLPLR